jgi:hypothetical protein
MRTLRLLLRILQTKEHHSFEHPPSPSGYLEQDQQREAAMIVLYYLALAFGVERLGKLGQAEPRRLQSRHDAG